MPLTKEQTDAFNAKVKPWSQKSLVEERGKLLHDNRALLDTAEKDNRQLSADEQGEYDRRDAELDLLSDEIQSRADHELRRQKLAEREKDAGRPLPRQVPPSPPGLRPPGRDDDGTPALKKKFNLRRAGKFTDEQLAGCAANPDVRQQILGRCSPDYGKVFSGYLRGDRGNYDSLGLMIGSDQKGGYLVPMEFLTMLIKFLDDLVYMRQLATVLPPTTAKSVGAVSYDADPADADWTPEVPASSLTEDTGMKYGARELMPHLLTKMVKASRKLVRSVPSIDSFVAGRLAYKFGITEEKAFLSGSGSQQPLGLFTPSNYGIDTSRDTTCAATTAFTADELIDCLGSLKIQYQMNSTWIFSRAFRTKVRKLKSGTGEYLLTPNNAAAGVDTLLERPTRVSENAPSTFTTGQYVAVLGDMSFYWIQDALGMEIEYLDQLFALTNQVGWVGRKETDAMPVLAEAFARLKLG